MKNIENGLVLLESMSFLDADLLEELPISEVRAYKRAAWSRWTALAASFLLIAVGVLALPHAFLHDSEDERLPEYTQGTWLGDAVEVSGVGVMPNVTGDEQYIPKVTTGAELTMPNVTGRIDEETQVLVLPDGSIVRIPESREPAVIIPSFSSVDYFELDGRTALYMQEDDRNVPVDGRYIIERKGRLWRFQHYIGDSWSGEEHFTVYGIADSGDILSVVTYERNTLAHQQDNLTDVKTIERLFEAMKTAKTGSRDSWAQNGGSIESRSEGDNKTVLNLIFRTERGQMECYLYPYADVIFLAGLEAVFALDEGEGYELFAELKGIDTDEIDNFIAAALDAEEDYEVAHKREKAETTAVVIEN